MIAITAACSDDYQPDLCLVVNIGKAQCNPTNPAKQKYDLDGIDMIGYTCMSPEDLSEGKKRARKIMENLD